MFIAKHTIVTGDPRFIEWDGKQPKQIVDAQGRLLRWDTFGCQPLLNPETKAVVYKDITKAVVEIKKGEVIEENILPRDEVERLLKNGDLEIVHDRRLRPGEIAEIRQDNMRDANRKPPGYVAPL
jgi:hypothetical protein